MCKKQTSVSHSSTESEIISLDYNFGIGSCRATSCALGRSGRKRNSCFPGHPRPRTFTCKKTARAADEAWEQTVHHDGPSIVGPTTAAVERTDPTPQEEDGEEVTNAPARRRRLSALQLQHNCSGCQTEHIHDVSRLLHKPKEDGNKERTLCAHARLPQMALPLRRVCGATQSQSGCRLWGKFSDPQLEH